MKNNRIYLSPPHISGREKEFLLDAFNSNWIAPIGPQINLFERNMSSYLGEYHTAALSSGTAALHLALKIIGIKEGDIIFCPSLTFAATANAIVYERATPIFLDSGAKGCLVDPNTLEFSFKKYKPKAIITVDLYGHSCDYDIIVDLCNKYNVHLIEDAAEALGSEYKNRKCGTFGSMGILSFNGNKIITTSGGGMIVSNNKNYIKKAKFLSTQARENAIHYEHKELGYNYRLSNILASIGVGQLEKLDVYVTKRRKIFQRYFDSLSNIEGFQFTAEASNEKSNRWLTTLSIDNKKTGITKDKIIDALEKENIESRPVWKPMHLQPFYKKEKFVKSGLLDNSAKFFENGLCLPSGSSLSIEDQKRIMSIIKSLIK